VPSIHSYFSNKWFIKRFFIKETETRRGRNYFTPMTGSTSMKVASPSFILPNERQSTVEIYYLAVNLIIN
jgi:hypothetical protein